MATDPVTPEKNPASIPIPSDNQIPYTYKPNNTSLATPIPGLPGHTQSFDQAALSAEVANRYHSANAAMDAKRAETLRQDTMARPGGPVQNAVYRPAPKRGK